jgi:hypothetical protein
MPQRMKERESVRGKSFVGRERELCLIEGGCLDVQERQWFGLRVSECYKIRLCARERKCMDVGEKVCARES